MLRPKMFSRVVAARDQRHDLVVDEADEPPDDVGGQEHRQDDDEAGQEVGAQPLRSAGASASSGGGRASGPWEFLGFEGNLRRGAGGTSATARGRPIGGISTVNGGRFDAHIMRAHAPRLCQYQALGREVKGVSATASAQTPVVSNPATVARAIPSRAGRSATCSAQQQNRDHGMQRDGRPKQDATDTSKAKIRAETARSGCCR